MTFFHHLIADFDFAPDYFVFTNSSRILCTNVTIIADGVLEESVEYFNLILSTMVEGIDLNSAAVIVNIQDINGKLFGCNNVYSVCWRNICGHEYPQSKLERMRGHVHLL